MMKFLLMGLLCLGVFMSYSSSSYFGIWVGLEVSAISIYPLLMVDKSEPSCISLVKILVLQAVSSVLLLLGLCIFLSLNKSFMLATAVVISSILMKVGGFSTGWLVFVLESLDWWSLFVILGVQKLPILAILLAISVVFPTWLMLMSGIVLSCMSFIGHTAVTFRSFMVMSSVLNMGWVWCSCTMSDSAGCVYFGFYLLSFISVVLVLSFSFLKEYGTMFSHGAGTGLESLSVWLMSGLPPFVLFFCKVDVIWLMTESGFVIECWCLIFFSVLMVYMYSYMMYVAVMCSPPYQVGKISSGGVLSLAAVVLVVCGLGSITFFFL